MKTLGFLGMGNMAKAISGGLIEKGAIPAENIYAYDVLQDKLAETAKEQGFRPCATAEELVKNADAVLVAVKPFLVEAVLSPLKDLLKNKVLLSVAASWDFARYETILDPSTRHLFIMPNTPALVGEAMSALCCNEHVSETELSEITSIFDSFGICETVPESLMDTVVGVSGSSPAYVFLFLEAMADAAVADGMPRSQAYKFAAQAVLGAAKMVLETGSHPGLLKDAVCSPGGTTIEAVAALESQGLRSAVIKAQRACVEKSREMDKKAGRSASTP